MKCLLHSPHASGAQAVSHFWSLTCLGSQVWTIMGLRELLKHVPANDTTGPLDL